MKLRNISLVAFVAVVAAMLSLGAHPSNAARAATQAATPEATMSADQIAKLTLVRVIHASQSSPNVDVYIDKDKAVDNLAYGEGTNGYLPVPFGDHHLKVTEAGDTTNTIFEADVTLDGGLAVTLVAEGSVAEKTFTIRSFNDNVSDTKGKARVKIIHAIPKAESIDLWTADFSASAVEGLEYGSAYTFTLTPDTYDLVVVPNGKKTTKDVVVDLKGSKFEADTIYTIVLSGDLNGKATTKVQSLTYKTVPIPGYAAPAVATAAATAAK